MTTSIDQTATATGLKHKIHRLLQEYSVFSWIKVMTGNGLYVSLGFAANLIMANGLTPATYGLLSMALAVMVIVQQTCGSGIDLSMVRLAAPYVQTDPARSQQIFKTALHIKLLFGITAIIVLWIVAEPAARFLLEKPELETPLRWAALGILGAALYGWILARFQAEERFNAYAAFRSANNILKVAGLGLLWYLAAFTLETVLALSVGVFFLSFGIGLFFVPRLTVKPDAHQNSGSMMDLLRFGRWIIASHILFAFYSRIDLLFVGKLTTIQDAGFYSVGWNFTFLMDLCTYSVIQAMLPQAARLKTRAEIITYLRRTFILCIGIAVTLLPLYFLAAPLVHWLYPGYSPAVEIFRVLFWGPLLTVLVHPLYLIFYARNRVAVLSGIDLVLVIVCAAGCYILIPGHGMLGGAYATLTARIINCLLILLLISRELRKITDNERGAS